MRIASVFGRHASGLIAEALLLAALAVALLLILPPFIHSGTGSLGVGTASAGRYWVEVDSGVYASTTQAEVYGDRTDYWLQATCSQDGGVVYQEWVKTDDAGHATLTLGPTERWTGGSADCVANAGYYGKNFKWKGVASTRFFVSGS